MKSTALLEYYDGTVNVSFQKWLKQDQPVGRVLKERDRACLQFRLKTRSITIRYDAYAWQREGM